LPPPPPEPDVYLRTHERRYAVLIDLVRGLTNRVYRALAPVLPATLREGITVVARPRGS
jgi:hypothetical protein